MIVIASRGACHRRAIELIGFTSKDGVNTVGRFGSGTAYAIALALRLGVNVTISSHDDDGPYVVKPYAKDQMVGSISARQIMWRYHRGSSLFKSWWDTALKALSRGWSVPTSFHVGLGERDWTGLFPIVREFVSNARDADPAGFQVWLTDEHLEKYLADAKEAGYTTVTVVQLDGPPELEQIIEDWNEHFRFEENIEVETLHRHDRWGAIFRKTTPSPVRIFVKGVRCPWPLGEAPVSLYDYSIDAELNEARSLKSPGDAATKMTYLWNSAVSKSYDYGAELLRGIQENPEAWEAKNVNEYATYVGISHELSRRPWVGAWREAYGDAPVRSEAEPEVPGSVVVAPVMRDFLVNSGVPAAKDRMTVVRTADDQPVVVVPKKVGSIVIEIDQDEARDIIRGLAYVGKGDSDLVAKLTRAIGDDAGTF